jgi:membrane protein
VETYGSLHKRLLLTFEEMEQILDIMNRANMVRQVKGGGWVLILDPARITIADIFRLFTFQTAAAHAAAEDNPKLELLLNDIWGGINEKMNMPLSLLFDGSSISKQPLPPSSDEIELSPRPEGPEIAEATGK